MSVTLVSKLTRHHRRLSILPPTRKIRYILSVLIGELYRKRGVGPFGPPLIELNLTNRSQCHGEPWRNEKAFAVSQESELSSGEIALILKDASRLGFKEVNFSGGEPLMRGDILELIRIARTAHMLPQMHTNGILLTDDVVVSLKQAGLSWCAVDIDSADFREHDRLRGYDGCFHLATRGIRSLVYYGIPTCITTHVRRETIANGDVHAIINMGYSLCVDTVHLLFPFPVGGPDHAESRVLNRAERQMTRKLLSDPLVTMESPEENTRGTAAVTRVYVLPDGNVTPSVFVPTIYGNVRKERLASVFKRMATGSKERRTSSYVQ
jgi:MoaA/NifB/PqqE/SkfB family radical SAM enzyme